MNCRGQSALFATLLSSRALRLCQGALCQLPYRAVDTFSQLLLTRVENVDEKGGEGAAKFVEEVRGVRLFLVAILFLVLLVFSFLPSVFLWFVV